MLTDVQTPFLGTPLVPLESAASAPLFGMSSLEACESRPRERRRGCEADRAKRLGMSAAWPPGVGRGGEKKPRARRGAEIKQQATIEIHNYTHFAGSSGSGDTGRLEGRGVGPSEGPGAGAPHVVTPQLPAMDMERRRRRDLPPAGVRGLPGGRALRRPPV